MMSTIDKSKFQFVKRDDFASEVIDTPAYSYLEFCISTVSKEKIYHCNVNYFGSHRPYEFYLSHFCKL